MGLRDRRTQTTCAIVAALNLLILATASFAQGHHGAMGVWVLNVQKSTFEPGPKPRTQSSTYTQLPDGSVKIEIDGVDSEGKSFRREIVSKFDGREARAGSAEPTTRAYHWVDDVDFEFTETINGKPSVIGRSSTSKDGKVRTLTVRGTRGGRPVYHSEVYERR